MSLKSQTLKICVSYHRVPQMPNWGVWTFSHQQLGYIKSFSKAVWQDNSDVLSRLPWKHRTNFIEVKSLVSESHSNTMEVNDNVYLKIVKNIYKKHEGNTRGNTGRRKWPKVELG